MWYFTLDCSGIIHCHAWPDLLIGTRPCSHKFPMIIWLGNLKLSRFMLFPSEDIYRILFHILGSHFTWFGIWLACCFLNDFMYTPIILFRKQTLTWTTTATVASLPANDCSNLRPTILIFITIPTLCDHTMNLCNINLTTNCNMSISQTRHIFFYDGVT